MERISLMLITIVWVLSILLSYHVHQRARDRLNSSITERTIFTKRIENFKQYYHNLREAETSQRGFLITSDPNYLKPYLLAIESISQSHSFLQQEKQNADSHIVQKIENLAETKLKELEEVLVAHQNLGFEAAKSKVADNQGKNLMQEIENELFPLVSQLEQKREIQDRKIKDEFYAIYRADLLGNLVYLLFSISLIFLLYRKMKNFRATGDQLKQAQDDLSFALVEAKLGTWEWNLKTNAIDWSNFTRSLFGVQQEKNLTIESFFAQIVPEDKERLTHKLYKETIAQGKPFSDTYRVLLPTGSVRSIASRGRVFYDQHREPVKLIGICWDETEISHSYKLLQASHGISRVLNDTESIPEAMSKIISILNQSFGWQILVLWNFNEQTKSLECIDVVHDPTIQIPIFKTSIEHLPAARADSIPNQVFSSYRPIWFNNFAQERHLIRAEAAEREGIQGALAIPILEESHLSGVLELFKKKPLANEEIDQGLLNLMTTLGIELGQFIKKREAYNTLRQTEEKYRQVIEITEEWIYEVDLNFVFTFTNHRVQTILGYGVKEILGKEMLSFIALSDLDKVRQKCSQIIKNKKGWTKWNLSWQAKDGVIHELESNAKPIFDNNHELIGFRGNNRDITELLKIERSKSEFISVVSHELRTPLTSIHGALGLINADSSLSEDAKELLEIAYRNSERLTRIINDILDVEKLRLGKLEIKLESTRLDSIVRDSMKAAMPLAQKNQIELVEESEFPTIYVDVDHDRLIQVMLNLLNNAINFSFPHNAVYVSIFPFDGYARVSVHDDGVGISEEFKPKIFDKFAQADSSDSRSGKGTGLGLSICKSLIERFGGKIGFHSLQGKGSTFYFDLPLSQKEV